MSHRNGNIKSEIDINGYAILRKVLDVNVLKSIGHLTNRIIDYGEKNLEDPFSNYYLRHRTDQGALYDLFQRHPEFQDLAKNKTILSSLEEVLGNDIFLYENSLVYKPKGKRNEVPWHQDFINRPNEPIKYIAWRAFDQINRENGALKVIPGSHKSGFLPWFTVEGETHHTRVKPEYVDESKAVYVELNAGDVLIFHQLILHGSDRITETSPRRAYRVSYQGFDSIFTPRGTPIVLKGGSPESLEQKFAHPGHNSGDLLNKRQKPFIRKIINKIGNRLSRF